MNEKYFRKENESDLDYAMRLIEIKKEEKPNDLDWDDIVNLLGLDLNKDSLRKSQDTIFGGIAVYKKMKELQRETEPEDYQEAVRIQLEELKKERIKIQDERKALNRQIRKEARSENIKELAYECADRITVNDRIDLSTIKICSDLQQEKTAILTLSDMHFGLEINEFNNVYNEEVFVNRLNKLVEKTILYITKEKVNKIYVLGLGDYLSGIIHNSIRIENRETIVDQVIKISNYIQQLLETLSKVCPVYYCDVNDNHGRIFADKNDCKNSENFSLFVRWYLESKFADSERVHILKNEINEEIGCISIYGKNYAFTHGHRDKVGDVVQNLSLMTGKFYQAIFMAHTHHFEANETHGTYIYVNGTFSGTDSYANNLRKTSNPSQNLFILNPTEGIECQYLIKL